jgi:hypothetical protein
MRTQAETDFANQTVESGLAQALDAQLADRNSQAIARRYLSSWMKDRTLPAGPNNAPIRLELSDAQKWMVEQALKETGLTYQQNLDALRQGSATGQPTTDLSYLQPRNIDSPMAALRGFGEMLHGDVDIFGQPNSTQPPTKDPALGFGESLLSPKVVAWLRSLLPQQFARQQQ